MTFAKKATCRASSVRCVTMNDRKFRRPHSVLITHEARKHVDTFDLAVTGESVTLAYVDQGYTGPATAEAAAAHGIRLEVVKLPEARRGFVLLPRRWVVERSFAWTARCRRLARDYERLAETLRGPHFVAFALLLLARLVALLAKSA